MVPDHDSADADGMTDRTDTMDTSTMDPTDANEHVGRLPPPLPPPPRTSWWDVPLARDQDAGEVGGVIAGLCRAYGFDVRTTRIAMVISAVVLPAVLVLYLAAWILLPPRLEDAASLHAIVTDRRRVPLMVAIGLAVTLGGFGTFGSWTLFGGLPWGLALIVIGVLLWMSPKLGTPPSTGAVATTTAVTSDTRATAGVAAPTTMTARTMTSPMPPPPPGAASVPARPAPARPRYPVASVALLASILLIAGAAVGDAAGWWDVSVLGVVLATLAIVFVGIVVSAIVNRSWAVLASAVPVLVLVTGLAIVQPNLQGGIGDREVRPTRLVDAELHEQLAAGRLEIDLTSLPANAPTVTVRAEVGFGRLHVIAPEDVALDVSTEVGAGRALLDGDEVADGLHQSYRGVAEPRADSSTTDRRTIVLDLEVGAGEIDIDRLP